MHSCELRIGPTPTISNIAFLGFFPPLHIPPRLEPALLVLGFARRSSAIIDTVGRTNVETSEPYEFIGILTIMFKNTMNSYGLFDDDDENTYEFIAFGGLNMFSSYGI